MRSLIIAAGLALAGAGTAHAQDQKLTATIRALAPVGAAAAPGDLGTVTLGETASGLTLATALHGLPPGPHGLHIHAKGDCGPGPDPEGKTIPGGAAGGHLDPANTGRHLGPEGNGHLGDLPVLDVAADGTATATLTAPRITTLDQVRGRALMIHSGGDNYSDEPEKLGGGGGRIACGVIG